MRTVIHMNIDEAECWITYYPECGIWVDALDEEWNCVDDNRSEEHLTNLVFTTKKSFYEWYDKVS